MYGGDEAVEGCLVLSGEPHAVWGVVVADDEDLGKERLVELAPDVVGCLLVGVAAVLEQVECGREVVLDVVEVTCRSQCLLIDVLDCARDSVLLSLEQLDRDSACVVGFHEFRALSFELVALEPKLTLVGFGLCASFEQLAADCSLDLLAKLGLEASALVVVNELLLDFVDQDGFLGAAGALRVASAAHEVLVGLAVGGA